MRLTAKNAKTLPVGLYRLDRGIYLRVTETSRFWFLKIQRDGKRREFGLGGVEQPIETVRNTAAKIRATLLEGKDPVELKEEAKPKDDPLFSEYSVIALEQANQLRKWAPTTREVNLRHNRIHLVSRLGNKRMSQITITDLLEALEPIWVKSTFASSILMILSYVIDFAHMDGYTTISKQDLHTAVRLRLPSHRALNKVSPVKHHSALPPEELRGVVHELAKRDTMTLKCVLFGILTVGRVSEYCKAKWSEIDLEKGIFTLPVERRKDKRPEPFRVPLSKQAIDLLKSLPRNGDYVFSVKDNKPLVTASPWQAYRNLLKRKITLHGCRSSFSDWCAQNNKNFLVSEKCLMHTVGNAVFMAYQRDDLLDQRRILLQEWADYLYS